MDKIIKKVDRVSTIEEASKLHDFGVQIIGISLYRDPRFNDNRVIKEDAAIEIIEVLNILEQLSLQTLVGTK